MATSGGPNTTTEGLVFGYDTGYPIADTAQSLRFNKGQPTTNLITNSGTSNTGWAGYGWTGEQAISNDYSNTYEFTATNGWHNRTFDTGVTSGGTIQVTFEYKLKQQETTQNQLFVLNGTHLGSYTNYIGNGSMTFEWQTFNGTFTANADSKVAIGPRGSDSSGLTDIVYIRNLQVEKRNHATPFIQGTRSVSGSLIDLTRTNDIDLSNVSFDSNAQMTFDGTNDYIITSTNVTVTGDQSIETLIKFDTLEGFLQGLISNHDYVNTSNFGINQVRSDKIGISIGYTDGSREYQDKYSTTAVVTGRFYHIVMTFNLSANQCKLYIDGELDSTFNLTKTVKYTSRPMVMGRWDYQYQNYYFDGNIAQGKYYSKTLSSEEVKQNYNALKNRFNI